VARIFKITDRHKQVESAKLSNFDLSEVGEIESTVVITSDSLTPYCVDAETKCLYFAELPASIQLERVSFIYVEQQMHATKLIAVPFSELPSLADQIERPLLEVFVFNSARCGSTLLHRALNSLDGVVSLAEYDVFKSVYALAEGGYEQAEIAQILSHCLTFCGRSFAGQVVAHKFKHDTVEMAALFQQVRPLGKNLYLYRNAIDWSASWLRINKDLDEYLDAEVVRDHLLHLSKSSRTSYLSALLQKDQATIATILVTLMMWVDSITGYIHAHEQSVPFLTVRYEDLEAQFEAVLKQIFSYIGMSGSIGAETLNVSQSDSQAGTAMARESNQPNAMKLTPQQVELVTHALQVHPRRLTPHMKLPGTLLLPT
jgi:hypothetical protein